MNVLAREGEYWTVVYGGRVSRVRDAKGLHYLQHLLRHPGEEVHALALVAAVDRPAPPAGPGAVDRADGLVAGALGDAGPVLDAQAVAAYRRRYVELQAALVEAEEADDETGLRQAQDELDALAAQLAGGTGLGGRLRRASAPAERARLAVTKAVRAAVRRLEQADPELGRHLDRTVRTGTFCSYAPDPAAAVEWRSEPAAVPGRSAEVRRRPARSPLVGRALERGLVRELVAAAVAERGGLLLVRGEAGIGKTRLAEEAMAAAEDREMGAFAGRCVDATPALVWLPFVEVLDQVFRGRADTELAGLLAGIGPEVARVVPALRRRFPDLPPPPELPAEQSRLSLFAGIRDLVLRLGSIRPAVVVLEDLHWADEATLHMLAHLVDRLEDARVLVVGTYRSDEAALGTPLAQTLERLVRHPAATTITLGRLSTEEVAELVAARTGRAPAPALSARLAAAADGNPFFVEELVKHLGGAEAGFDGVRPVPVPESLRLLLGHRLQRLAPESRTAVDLAAVAGRDVDVGLLADMLGEGEDRTVDAVDGALAAGVLVVDGEDGGRLRFRHALLRQAALEELSPVRLRWLHGRVARVLEDRHGEDPQHAGEIADHWEKAGSGSPRYLELAGRRSLDVAAYADAADRFRRALDLAPAGEPATKARLLAGLGYAQRGLGAPSDAHASWLAALELLKADGEEHRALAAELSRALGRSLDATGGLDQAVALLERGLRSVGAEPTAERSWLTSALGYARSLQGDVAGATALLDEAAIIAGALEDGRLRADVLASRTSLAFITGRLRDCVATAEAAERALLACGQVWDAVQAKVTTVWPRLWLGRPPDARRQTEEVLVLAERVGHVPGMFLGRRSIGLLDLVETGNLERFTASAAEGLAHCQQHRLRWLADAHVMLGLARFWAGDWAGASEQFHAAHTAPAPPVYAGRYGATLLTFLGWAGDGGAFDRVRAGIQADLERVGPGPTLGSLAATLAEVEALALLGRRSEAAALYPAVAAAIDDGLVLRPPDLRVVEALAGVAAGMAGERNLAQGHFERARRLVASLPHPRQAPDVDFLCGLALADGALLARAAEGYRTLGMPAHAARAEGSG